jgi:menaquinone-9 beta-reductase
VTETVETVVVGGGPAGAAAAALLAEAGREVVLVERERAARPKVCGEFVSTEALAATARLGLDAGALGAAAIERVRLTWRGRSASAALPFPAAGLSRTLLDRALLETARRRGADVRLGIAVRRIERAADGARVLCDGSEISARRVILATGKHDLGGVRRSTRWPGRERMLGLKMHLRFGPAAAARLGRRVDLHVFRGGCAGLQPVEGGAANLCVTLDGERYRRAGGAFAALLAELGQENPALGDALAGAAWAWPRPVAIARVPYGFLRPEGGDDESVWHVGDQVAVTPSFTGDGLAMALESGIAAAESIIAGRPRRAFEAGFARRAARQMRPAMRLQAVVDRPGLHRPAMSAVRFAPGLLAALARRTRLPPAA